MLKIEWSIANNCFVVMFGNTITDIDGQRFFNNKKELTELLKTKGLKLNNNSIIAA